MIDCKKMIRIYESFTEAPKQIVNGYEIANGSAINGLFQYKRRKAPNKFVNGYKIVKGAAVNNLL